MVNQTRKKTKATDYQAHRPEPDQPVELSENARTVLTRRYLRKGPDGRPAETVEEMFWRVAWHVAEPETQYGGDRQAVAESFYRLLTDKYFFPNSPTFTGAGTPLGQLAACFVLGISDDMGRNADGIFQTLRDAALIQQTGGGNGFSFSRLRPSGARVSSSNGQATGPVGFLRVYDQAFGEIAQGGSRRGANMGVLRVDHPDIGEFITCKTDENAITNFNISVGITDQFMQAVRDNTDFDLINPQDGSIWETVNARELFDRIVQQAYHNGEPGILFLDAANRDNPVPHLYEIEATNPCFAGDTRIATEFGLLTIKQLADFGIPAFIATDNRACLNEQDHPSPEIGVALRQATPVWMTCRQMPVKRLMTERGYTVVATSDHRFLTSDGYVALEDLQPGDCLLLQSAEGAWSRDYQLPNVEYIRSLKAEMAAVAEGELDNFIQYHTAHEDPYADLPERWSHGLGLTIGWLLGENDSPIQLPFDTLPFELLPLLGVPCLPVPDKRIPETIWAAPREAVVGFLQGLFSADGEVITADNPHDCTVLLASRSPQLLADVQLLLSNFGIISHCTPDELTITGSYLVRFAELIGFMDDEMQAQLKAFMEAEEERPSYDIYADAVLFIEDAGYADVYDLNQPQTNSLIANGLVAHNCGEQFLGPGENCCLGSINLAPHITADNQINWEKLQTSVELATRFLDDVVDANNYVPAVPALREAAQRVRRIGLGIMGLSDMMYRLGVRYGSEAGQEFASQVMEFVHYHAMRTSIELAKEREPFPAIKGSRFDPDDLQWQTPQPLFPYTHDWNRPELDWSAIETGIKEHGIRNGAHTTIAPTGTISTVSSVEGYGCEPVFALAYTRYFDDNGTRRELQYTSPAFEKALAEAGLDKSSRDRIIKQTSLTGSCQAIKDLPESIRKVFVVSNDITAAEHVRMQAALQRFISNAISKTCNFPADATPEDVASAYQLAWELGCKGLTVYVTGKRDKVVLETAATAQARDEGKTIMDNQETATKQQETATNGNQQNRPLRKIDQTATPPDLPASQQAFYFVQNEIKRPRHRVLKGYTYRMETPLGTTFITINENGGNKPFEVFVQTAKAGSETAAHSEAIGRLISYILRMNSPVDQLDRLKEVVRQLEGIGGGRSLGLGPNRVRSLPDGIAQTLAEYLADVEEDAAPEQAQAATPSPGQMSLPLGVSADLCPECGQGALVNEEGCRKCYACGFSEC